MINNNKTIIMICYNNKENNTPLPGIPYTAQTSSCDHAPFHDICKRSGMIDEAIFSLLFSSKTVRGYLSL